jgi:hypothetical protein
MPEFPLWPENAPDRLQPGRLWSLWEMVNFSFSSANTLLSELRLSISVARNNMEIVEREGGHARVMALGSQKNLEALSQADEGVKFCATLAEKIFSSLRCPHVDAAIKRLRYWLEADENHKTWAELFRRSVALRDAIETEFKEYLFYQYPKGKGEKLKAWREDWGKSIAAFPAIELDVFAATDCYALQHNTASVFHSMRVAEIGLRAVVRERRLTLPKDKPVEWGTWQEIIRALDDEIKAIGVHKRAGEAKDKALEFYSGARADLNGFKDEFRNLVSHVRVNYDEFQAIRALTNVNTFMERISVKIDHTHKTIDWGF